MIKLLGRLLALFNGSSAKTAPKVGSERDPIRQMLFASQSLHEHTALARRNNSKDPFQLVAAAKLAREGKKPEAIKLLQGVLQWPGRETRSELFLWAALRELGVQPDQQLGSEVLGVVFEMPMKKGCDTLAAYADGSARYLNFSGAGIFWDAPDPTIGALGRNMIDATIPPSPGIRPRATLALPREKPQVTLLTRSGNYVLVGPPQKVLDASTALMLGLTSRNKAARQA